MAMRLQTPEKIRTLQRKLYLKAKADAGTVFGDLGVLRLRRVHLGPPPCAPG